MYPSPRGNGLWWLTAGLAVVLLLLPFLLVEVPPVQDYPNHLARLYVLADGGRDPILAAMYEPRWSILPNLAIDIIGPPLHPASPPSCRRQDRACRQRLLFPLIGVVVYARAAFGAWSAWSLASALVAYNAIFVLGFMNFLFSLGIALDRRGGLDRDKGKAAGPRDRRRGGDLGGRVLLSPDRRRLLCGASSDRRKPCGCGRSGGEGASIFVPCSGRPPPSPWRFCRRSSSTRSRRPPRPTGSHCGARRSASCTSCSCRSWPTTSCSLR